MATYFQLCKFVTKDGGKKWWYVVFLNIFGILKIIGPRSTDTLLAQNLMHVTF